MDDNFDPVQWRDDDDDLVDDFTTHHHRYAPPPPIEGPGLNGGRPAAGSSEPLQAGPNADALDLAGVGRGVLETTVSDPQTESEGTKDAYVSYLVTTEVCTLERCCSFFPRAESKLVGPAWIDRLSNIPETAGLGPPALH